mgnify:CR=1 FL=1
MSEGRIRFPLYQSFAAAKASRRLGRTAGLLTRNPGGSVGSSFTPTVPAERLQFHHAWLAEHIRSMMVIGAAARASKYDTANIRPRT